MSHSSYFRDSHEVSLADMMVSGVLLSNGRLSGLANMARWGNATLEVKYIRIYNDVLIDNTMFIIDKNA